MKAIEHKPQNETTKLERQQVKPKQAQVENNDEHKVVKQEVGKLFLKNQWTYEAFNQTGHSKVIKQTTNTRKEGTTLQLLQT